MPGATGAVSVSQINRTLLDIQEIHRENFLDGNQLLPILGFDDPTVVDSEDFIIETFVELLKIGTFTARPEAGVRDNLEKMRKALGSVAFLSDSFDLKGWDMLNLVQPPDPNETRPTRASRRKGLKRVNTQTRLRVRKQLRTYNNLAAQILCKQTPTITDRNGTTVQLNYGTTFRANSADWTAAGTNILLDFEKMLNEYIDANHGRRPNKVLFRRNFHQKYILQNDELRKEFCARQPGLLRGFLTLPELGQPQPMEFETIIVDDVIDINGGGTTADLSKIWADDIMTFVHKDETIEFVTAETADNDYKGGMNTYFSESDNPRKQEISTHSNGAFSIGQGERIQINKLVP